MKVGKINSDIGVKPDNTNKPAFKGNAASTLTRTLSSEVNSYMPKGLAKIMPKFKTLQGELGGIVVTAIGTGAVAPIFIAFNPISKTDSDTKKYTAMRQPVSAVLAVIFQAGMIIPVAKMLEKAANEGKLGSNVLINKVALQSEKYLELKFKKELKASGEYKKLSKKVREEKIKELITAEREKQKNALVEALKRDGKITIGGNDIKPEKIAEIVRDTLNDYSKPFEEELEKLSHKDIGFKVKRAQTLVNNEIELKQTMGEILKWEEGTDFRRLLSIMSEEAKSAGNNDLAALYAEFNEKIGKKYKHPDLETIQSRAKNTICNIDMFKLKIARANALKAQKEKVSGLLKKLADAKPGDNLDEMLKNGLDSIIENEDVKKDILKDMSEHHDLASKKAYAQNLVKKIEKLANATSTDEILKLHQENYYLFKKEALQHKIDIIKTYLDDLKPDSTGKVASNKIKSIIDNAGAELKTLEGKNVYKDIVSMYEKHRDNAFGINKNIKSALIATLIFLPITCTVLNWVYPRFMDLFFPSLAKSKTPPNGTSKDGSKLDVKEGK